LNSIDKLAEGCENRAPERPIAAREAQRDEFLAEPPAQAQKYWPEAEGRAGGLRLGEGVMNRGEPLPLYETEVAADWVDYNGHMNDAAYALVFSRALDALMDRIGLDAAARKAHRRTLYTLQVMLHYFQETSQGEALFVRGRLLEHDDKRMRVWLEMKAGREGANLAASEQLLISVDQSEARARAAPWRAETKAALDALANAQRGLEVPPLAGHGVALKWK
jgi:acyl-CoA thioester hydrolase